MNTGLEDDGTSLLQSKEGLQPRDDRQADVRGRNFPGVIPPDVHCVILFLPLTDRPRSSSDVNQSSPGRLWEDSRMIAIGLRKLFSSVQLGPSTLQHRVVMASLARSRSVQPGGVPGDLIKCFSTLAENSEEDLWQRRE